MLKYNDCPREGSKRHPLFSFFRETKIQRRARPLWSRPTSAALRDKEKANSITKIGSVYFIRERFRFFRNSR
jgi:hypothetical protein